MLRSELSRYVQAGSTRDSGSLGDAREIMVGVSRVPIQVAKARYNWRFDREFATLESTVRQLRRLANEALRKTEHEDDTQVVARLEELKSQLPEDLLSLPRLLAVQQLDGNINEMNQEIFHLRSQKTELQKEIEREYERQRHMHAIIEALRSGDGTSQAPGPKESETREREREQIMARLKSRMDDLRYIVKVTASKFAHEQGLDASQLAIELQELLEGLLNTLAGSPASYFQVSDGSHPAVNILVNSSVAIRDPADPSRLRLRSYGYYDDAC